MGTIIFKLFSLINSFIFCLRVFPLKTALRIPVYITNTQIGPIHRGCIIINAPIKRGMILIGFDGSEGIITTKGYIGIHKKGKLIINGKTYISKGTSIRIDKGGELSIGKQFYCNSNCFIRCTDKIHIGENVLFGWNVTLNTYDGHNIYVNNKANVNHGSIFIGNNVWIASNATISKNVTIGNNCVISQLSLLTKEFPIDNLLIGGIPAKIIKTEISWSV